MLNPRCLNYLEVLWNTDRALTKHGRWYAEDSMRVALCRILRMFEPHFMSLLVNIWPSMQVKYTINGGISDRSRFPSRVAIVCSCGPLELTDSFTLWPTWMHEHPCLAGGQMSNLSRGVWSWYVDWFPPKKSFFIIPVFIYFIIDLMTSSGEGLGYLQGGFVASCSNAECSDGVITKAKLAHRKMAWDIAAMPITEHTSHLP